jgi:ferritin-like metal-binding protein YciE
VSPGVENLREQLIKHLTDAHAIEVQALAQMRRAPKIAGTGRLASIFEQHLLETERHEALIRERLEALDAEPSTSKDLAGRLGAYPMVMFAKLNPDTPGKLLSHAYSYEHMELAAYELLERVARRAGDQTTEQIAREIAVEEQAMADKLEASFDEAVEESLREQDPDDLGEQLNSYLGDAHALEGQVARLLALAPEIVEDADLLKLFGDHLAETKEHERRVRERLEGRDAGPSLVKDAALRLGAVAQAVFFGGQPDTPAKLVGFAFAHEYLEVAGYEQLRRVADRAGDPTTAVLASEIAEEERAMGIRLAECWDLALESALEDKGLKANRS